MPRLAPTQGASTDRKLGLAKSLAAALLLILGLAACDAKRNQVPRYDDAGGIRSALSSLSPWENGGPDRSHDGLTTGDMHSDRETFRRWVQRYFNNEVYLQHSKGYRPFDVPATIGDAIEEQRKLDAEVAASRERTEQNLAAAEEERQKIIRQEEAEKQRREAANRIEADAENDRQQAHLDCIARRMDAASHFGLTHDSSDNDEATRLWNSFHCDAE